MNLPILQPQQDACTLCELHTQVDGDEQIPRNVGIGTRYLEDSLDPTPEADAIIYVGRNPGFYEDERGQCFIGPSGKMLTSVYIDGISARTRASCYLTNAVRCYTLDNDPPKARHYKACLPFLIADLEAIARIHLRAKILVVLLGGEACVQFHHKILSIKGVNLRTAFSDQGRIHCLPGMDNDFVGPAIQVFATYHPAAVLYHNNTINSVHGHNQLISDCLADVMATPSSPTIIPSRIPHP